MFKNYEELETKMLKVGFEVKKLGNGIRHFTRIKEDGKFLCFHDLSVIPSLISFDTKFINVIEFDINTGKKVINYIEKLENVFKKEIKWKK